MSKKVLIAEDSAVIQNIVRRILQAQKFTIDAVRNGNDVLSKLEENDYQVILMDINMPKMDGITCTKAIRALANGEKAQTPIIAITGNPENYSLEDFQEVGINDVVEKPINFDVLIEKIFKLSK